MRRSAAPRSSVLAYQRVLLLYRILSCDEDDQKMTILRHHLRKGQNQLISAEPYYGHIYCKEYATSSIRSNIDKNEEISVKFRSLAAKCQNVGNT